MEESGKQCRVCGRSGEVWCPWCIGECVALVSKALGEPTAVNSLPRPSEADRQSELDNLGIRNGIFGLLRET